MKILLEEYSIGNDGLIEQYSCKSGPDQMVKIIKDLATAQYKRLNASIKGPNVASSCDPSLIADYNNVTENEITR